MSGTSSLVVGKGNFEELSSQSKTTNGVGSAYGDGSYINMSPYQSPVNDPDLHDNHHYKHLYSNRPYYPFHEYNHSVQAANYFNPYVLKNQYSPHPPARS